MAVHRTTRIIFGSLAVLFAASTVFAGGGGERTPRDGVVEIYASVAPQADIIRRIGGEHVSVGLIIGPGQDAHSYDPTPREIERLAGSEIVFVTGLEYEFNVLRALERSAPHVEIVHLNEGIQLREIEPHWNDPTVPHGHDNEPGDPHVWLGFDEARIQAAHIRDTLTRARPALEEEFEAGYADFLTLVDELEAEIEPMLAHLEGSTVMVYHPAFGYFLDHFGIRQLGVEAGGREPSPRQLSVSIERALAADVSIIFTQPEYDDVASRSVARAVGARTEIITDLGDDWPELMRSIAEAFAQEAGR